MSDHDVAMIDAMKPRVAILLADTYASNVRFLKQASELLPTLESNEEVNRLAKEAMEAAEDSAHTLSALARLRNELGETTWQNLMLECESLVRIDGDISRLQAMEKMLEAGIPMPDPGCGVFHFGKEIE